MQRIIDKYSDIPSAKMRYKLRHQNEKVIIPQHDFVPSNPFSIYSRCKDCGFYKEARGHK